MAFWFLLLGVPRVESGIPRSLFSCVLVLFSIEITSLGEERAGLCAYRFLPSSRPSQVFKQLLLAHFDNSIIFDGFVHPGCSTEV